MSPAATTADTGRARSRKGPAVDDGSALDPAAPVTGEPASRRALRTQGRRTMRKLLDSAMTVFAKRGYHAARVDDIVKLANTSHGTFYLYFSNKEDLLRALVAEAGETVMALDDALGPVGPDADGWYELRGWMEQFSEAWRRYAPVLRAWTDLILSDRELTEQAHTAAGGVALTFARRVAEAGPAEGIEPNAAAEAVIAMVERFHYLRQFAHEPIDDSALDTLTTMVHRALFGGVAAPPDRRRDGGTTREPDPGAPRAGATPEEDGRREPGRRRLIAAPSAAGPGRRPFRAVVFDCFGTLTVGVTAADRKAGAERLAEALGTDPERLYVTERATGRCGDLEQTMAWLATRCGHRPSDEQLAAACAVRRDKEHGFITRFRADAVPVLAGLRRRGLRLGVVSDCTHELPELWSTLPVADLIEAAVFSVEVGARKPTPILYRTACDRLGVEPTDVLYVGDGGSGELTGARALGMTAVRLTAEDAAGAFVYDAEPDWTGPVIGALPEVLTFLP